MWVWTGAARTVAGSPVVTTRPARTAEGCLSTIADRSAEALVGRVRDGLSALRRADSLYEIIDHAPVVAAGLGFDRVLLSRVDDSAWVPERMYVKGDGRWAEEILEAGRRQYRLLDATLLETQMVRRAMPLRVTDPDNKPLMHRELVTSSRTRGYVAAPVTDGETVVGFLHADCYHQGRTPRTPSSRSCGSSRSRWAPCSPARAWRTGSTRRAAPMRAVPHSYHHALRELVTRREADVLGLMADP